MTKAAKDELDMEVKPHLVRSVMKHDLGMTFKKVIKGSLHANSDRNLVLRQRAALALVEQLGKNKIVLNIDETWLGMADFRRKKWCQEGDSNHFPTLTVNPRISMICGVDTLGNIYCSLV
jgi:hypothetical protein